MNAYAHNSTTHVEDLERALDKHATSVWPEARVVYLVGRAVVAAIRESVEWRRLVREESELWRGLLERAEGS